MSVSGPVGICVFCAMAILVLGGCGTDEAEDDNLRPPAAATPTRTAASLPALAPTLTVSAMPPPSPITPPPTTATPAATATATPPQTPAATPGPAREAEAPGPRVLVGGAGFAVELARTPEERNKGLSGRESLPPSAGMLFVFDPATAGAFWMRGMLFPLDFIWIGRGCDVVDVTLNAPAPEPGTPLTELPIYQIDEVAAYTLEVNAGEVERFHIQVGDEVEFSGFDLNGGGCRHDSGDR